jgi:hypothetical protein
MKIKTTVEWVVWGSLIVAIGYWFRGHDVLTGAALLLLFLLVATKVVFALVSRCGGSSRRDGDSRPPISPSPVTRPPRPPGAPPDFQCEHAA